MKINKIMLELKDALNIDMALEQFINILDSEIEEVEDKETKESFIALLEGMHETYKKIQKFLMPIIELELDRMTEEDIKDLAKSLGIVYVNEEEDVEEYELQKDNKIKIFDLQSIRNKTIEKVNQMAISEVKQQLVNLDRYRTGLSETELRKILVGALMEKALKSSLGGHFRWKQ